jgi:hypothetical protein
LHPLPAKCPVQVRINASENDIMMTYTRNVRTTINIRDQALELCRQKAEETGKSLGEVVSDAILQAYSGRPSSRQRRRYNLPVSGKGGLLPGVDLDDSSALQDVMDGLT